MACTRRAAGGVEQQGAHEQGIAGGGDAENIGLPGSEFLDALGGEAAVPVRAGQHTERAVGIVGIIEMKAHGKHLLEQFDGRLDVGNAILGAPRPEAGQIDTGAKGERQVLMPRDQPVGFGRFVEVNGADGERFERKMRAHEIEKMRRAGQSGHDRNGEQTATARTGNRAEQEN